MSKELPLEFVIRASALIRHSSFACHAVAKRRRVLRHFHSSDLCSVIADYSQHCGILVLRSQADFCKVTGLIWSAA
jgi:hypothetical protein